MTNSRYDFRFGGLTDSGSAKCYFLSQHSFKGIVWELKNIIERARLYCVMMTRSMLKLSTNA